MKVAFAGQSRSGKDEAIDFLMKNVEGEKIKLHIADDIYRMASQIKGSRIDNLLPADRRLLQDIGMAGRRYNPEVWIKALVENIREQESYKIDNIFITGIRFANEIKALREIGVQVVLLKRDDALRYEYGAPKDPHETEVPLEDGLFIPDDIIHNNSSLFLFHKSLYDRFLKKD